MRQLTFLIILFFSTTGFAQIKISKAKGVDISANKTFAIEKGQVISFNGGKINENKVFASFKEAVTAALTSRGYTLVQDSTAHLVVSYVYQESDRMPLQNQGPLGQKPIEDPADVDESYKLERSNGTRSLIIDIEKKNSSVWTATCGIDGEKDLDQIFIKTIESAFKKFPIQGK